MTFVIVVVVEIVSTTDALRIEPRNHDRSDEDDHYLKNIKLELLNFDSHQNPQYYLDWIMSLERYFSGMRCPKNDESVLLLRR